MVIQCRMGDGDFVSKGSRPPAGTINRASEFLVLHLAYSSFILLRVRKNVAHPGFFFCEGGTFLCVFVSPLGEPNGLSKS